MEKEQKKTALSGMTGFVKTHQKPVIAVCSLLLAVILLLLIINPANSPTSVFNRYLDCLRSQNEAQFASISYDANFSTTQTSDTVVDSYKARFSYTGSDNLLNDTDISIVKVETPKQSDIGSRRISLADSHRNTARIMDIRDITFQIRQGESVSTGTAALYCVTGKWYIGDVTGI